MAWYCWKIKATLSKEFDLYSVLTEPVYTMVNSEFLETLSNEFVIFFYLFFGSNWQYEHSLSWNSFFSYNLLPQFPLVFFFFFFLFLSTASHISLVHLFFSTHVLNNSVSKDCSLGFLFLLFYCFNQALLFMSLLSSASL